MSDTLDIRSYFCACAFMGKIYFTGVFLKRETIDSCLQFDPVNLRFKEMARSFAVFTVLGGRVVVSGGKDSNHFVLNNRESYDVIGDEWEKMPSMVEKALQFGRCQVQNVSDWRFGIVFTTLLKNKL